MTRCGTPPSPVLARLPPTLNAACRPATACRRCAQVARSSSQPDEAATTGLERVFNADGLPSRKFVGASARSAATRRTARAPARASSIRVLDEPVKRLGRGEVGLQLACGRTGCSARSGRRSACRLRRADSECRTSAETSWRARPPPAPARVRAALIGLQRRPLRDGAEHVRQAHPDRRVESRACLSAPPRVRVRGSPGARSLNLALASVGLGNARRLGRLTRRTRQNDRAAQSAPARPAFDLNRVLGA